MKQILKISSLFIFSLMIMILLTHCQQPTGSQTLVNIPNVAIACSSTNCASASGTHAAFVYVTSSGCLNIQYGQVATGTGNATCSAGTCTATISSWTNPSGASITQISSSTFDYCAILNIDNAYAGTVTASESTGTKKSVFVGNASGTVTLSDWINGNFTN